MPRPAAFSGAPTAAMQGTGTYNFLPPGASTGGAARAAAGAAYDGAGKLKTRGYRAWASTYENETPGLVPYFVSGPLARGDMTLGLVGTLLHVLAWVLAFVFDFVSQSHINSEQSPGAAAYNTWGIVTLLLSFAVLFVLILMHYFRDPIPEGAVSPWLMTLMMGGVQV